MISRIYVNGKFTHQRLTGVQRYAIEITSRLAGHVELLVPPRSTFLSRGPLWEQILLPMRIMNNGILWSPANTGPLAVNNQVVTIHDLSTIDHPQWFSSRFATWYRYLIPRLANRVNRIITDSNFTKSRLVEVLNIPEGKIWVIPLGVSNNFERVNNQVREEFKAKYKLYKPYLLSLGSLEPRKNIKGIANAWKQIQNHFPEFELVIVGDMGFPFRDPGIDQSTPGMRLLGRIEDRDLPALYSGAICFVYPSVYEGFGLPVLEAMACGTPVIASNTTSLPEVVGDAGLLINPYDVDDIASTFELVMNDSDLREKLSQLGIQQASKFSWDTTAEKVWDVLEQTHAEISS